MCECACMFVLFRNMMRSSIVMVRGRLSRLSRTQTPLPASNRDADTGAGTGTDAYTDEDVQDDVEKGGGEEKEGGLEEEDDEEEEEAVEEDVKPSPVFCLVL